MTIMDIAKRYSLQPKDITAYMETNATFPIKRNFQTGAITIPDDVDIENFIAPLIKSIQDKQNLAVEERIRWEREKAERKAQELKEQAWQEQMQAKQDARLKILQENQTRQESERRHAVSIEKLKATGAEGYYQYKAISLLDVGGLFRSNSGRVNTDAMSETLNALGMEGWHLVTAYSNELGKNALSGGAGGFIMGTNSTVDENILIFERFVRF